MDNANNLTDAMRAIDEMTKRRKEVIDSIAKASGAIDYDKAAHLLASAEEAKARIIRSMDTDFLNSPVQRMMEAMKHTFSIQEMITEQVERAVMAAAFPPMLPTNPVLEAAQKMTNIVAEMEKVSLLSSSLTGQIDWDAISMTMATNAGLVSNVRSSFQAYSQMHEAFFESLKLEPAEASVQIPELTRFSILNRYNTVEMIGLLEPFLDVPGLNAFREEARHSQILEFQSELEEMLYSLDPDFIDMLRGAEAAFNSGHVDHPRHWATSMRELMYGVLRVLSPDSEIISWTSDSQNFHNGKPTRACRIRYICRSTILKNKDALADDIEGDIQVFIDLIDLLSGDVHKKRSSLSDLPTIQTKVESMLMRLIKISKGTL